MLLNLDAVASVTIAPGKQGGTAVIARMRDGGETTIGEGSGDWYVKQMHHIGVLLEAKELKAHV